MDRGTLTDEEAITSICKRVPLHLHGIVSRFIKEFRMEQPKNPPMECFFIDDSPANIEASERQGMRGCVYHKDMEDLREQLKAVGIKID